MIEELIRNAPLSKVQIIRNLMCIHSKIEIENNEIALWLGAELVEFASLRRTDTMLTFNNCVSIM